MAPSYDEVDVEVDEDELSEIDFTDLEEAYEVRLEEGLDSFVVIDGIPVVAEDAVQRLVKFLLRKLKPAGETDESQIYMPVNEQGMSEGYAFVEYANAAQAATAVKTLNGTALDKKHTMAVNKLSDIEKFGREGRINETYVPPTIEPFKEREHLRSWLGDEDGRDQFIMYHGDHVGVFYNEREEQPENMVDRQHWTDSFVQWSPMGTYLASIHVRGVLLWGGASWGRLKRFNHPGVNLVDFSPNENYLTTWSHRPISIEDDGSGLSLSAEEEGKNYVVWDIATGKPLRSFTNLDMPGPSADDQGNPVKKKLQWPAFKWSADDKYVARMNPGQSVSIYELPRMVLLDKTSVKIEGIHDFEWSPSTPKRDGVRTYEQLFCFWTPEAGSNPAKVGLMSIPSKEIVRTRNLFNVSFARLHWQSASAYVCVKVDRHSKSKKSLATNLEIFRVREKGVPVEVVDYIKDPVVNFAWEPRGDRFVLITAGEAALNSAVPPKTSVSFFCPEKAKGSAPGNFKHIRTLDKRNSNAIYWAPKGRFVVVATVQSQQSFELDFFDLDYEGEKDEKDKDLMANLQQMGTADHYGLTDIEWCPSGRFLTSSSSVWKHSMEPGYHLYDFRGNLLREEHVEQFKQFSWRPRPPTLLSKEEQRTIRRNLREYSRVFEGQDLARKTTANKAVVEQRRRLLAEWQAWREQVEEDLREQRLEMGLPENPDEELELADGGAEAQQVVEEIVEEIIQETEEII